MARPRRKTERSTEQVVVPLTPNERDEIDAKREHGQSRADYVRRRAIGVPGPAPKATPPEVREALGQLGQVGNQLNQVARVHNTFLRSDEYVVPEGMVEHVATELDNLKEIVTELQQQIQKYGLPEVEEEKADENETEYAQP